MKDDCRKDFFDRTYTMREAYGRLWQFARPYRVRIFIGLACGILTAGTLVPMFQVVKPVLEKISQNQLPTPNSQLPTSSRLPSWFSGAERLGRRMGLALTDEAGGMGGALLAAVIVGLPLVALGRLLLAYLNQYCLSWAATHAVADLRQAVVEHVQRQSMQFVGRIDIGQLMARATVDPQVAQVVIQTMFAEAARAPFEILVSAGFIVWFAVTNRMMATLAVIVIGMPAFMLPVVGVGRLVRRWTRRTLERNGVIVSRLHEILTCARVIKAYHAEDYENARYSEVNGSLVRTNLKAVRWGLLVGPTVETVGVVLICGFVVYCFAAHVALANVMPMLAPLLLIYKPVKKLSELQVRIEAAHASLQRIWSILDVDMRLPENPAARAKATFSDRIVFEDVSFRYEGAERDAVSHASFEVPRGRMVAVVGSTGSGKTTMSGLLARFFDPQSGRVTMDGVDLRDLRVADLRRLVGSVQQETILFNDTIEENIRYGSPGATHDEVVAAAKMANAHDFIMSQPGGYQRRAGEKGFVLSGGERQRIAIARAILRNPPILILDEATSALDTVTERLVQDALAKLMANRTVLAIAHRLSTVRDADLILVMDRGRIVERGTHGELLAAGGVYARLAADPAQPEANHPIGPPDKGLVGFTGRAKEVLNDQCEG